MKIGKLWNVIKKVIIGGLNKTKELGRLTHESSRAMTEERDLNEIRMEDCGD